MVKSEPVRLAEGFSSSLKLLQPPLVNILRCSVINKDKALHELPFTEIVKYETVRLTEGFFSFTELSATPCWQIFCVEILSTKKSWVHWQETVMSLPTG